MKYAVVLILLGVSGCVSVDDGRSAEATFPVIEKWWK